ncbi:serine carboxypeptidase-like 17 [Capsicum galapagoense]
MAKTKLCYYLFLLLVVAGHATAGSTVKFLPGFLGPLPFELETGYVGVGDSEDVQLFYYFIKSESNPESDPLMLWVTGGPGCSALSGLIYEIANGIQWEFTYNDSESLFMDIRTKTASIIFLDFPVGTGFSYATTPTALQSSDLQASDHVHQLLHKWFVDHPEFLSNPLYVGGDSYSGMVITQIIGISKTIYHICNPTITVCWFSPMLIGTNFLIIGLMMVKLETPSAFERGLLENGTDVQLCNTKRWSLIAYHIMKTSVAKVTDLLYTDNDKVVTFRSTQAWIKYLNYYVLDDWRTWTLDNQVAGLVHS